MEPGALDANNAPCVDLTFKLIKNSVACLEQWCYQQQSTSVADSGVNIWSIANDYLHRIGLAAQLVPGLAGDIIKKSPSAVILMLPCNIGSK